jgi:ATP/maltotriose-dependent transcriptional regulator MalT
MLLGKEFRSREQFLDILQALVDLYTGHAREGRRAIEEIVREHDNLQLLGPDIPLVYIGNLDRQKRAFHKALLRHEAALELFEGRGVYTQASCLVSLGADKMRIDGGVSDAGLEELDATEAMAKKARADFVLAQVSFHRAWWALKQGDEKQALAAIEDSLGKAARNGYDHFIFREGRISLDLLALAFKNGIERDYLVEIFGRIGSVSLSPLAPLLQSEDPLTREATIRALSLAGGLSAVPRIQRMLRDSDDRVKMTARAELGSIREDIATPREMLSRREYEVLGIVAEGATNSEIAVRLVITETTVKSHVSSIFRKLNVSTRVQAVMYYEQPENSESDTGEDN